MKKMLFCLTVLLLASSCSGIRRSGDTFTTHAEAINIVGFQLPEDDYAKARSLVPSGAAIHTVSSNPNDWTSVLGVINRIFGVSVTQVSGTTK